MDNGEQKGSEGCFAIVLINSLAKLTVKLVAELQRLASCSRSRSICATIIITVKIKEKTWREKLSATEKINVREKLILLIHVHVFRNSLIYCDEH